MEVQTVAGGPLLPHVDVLPHGAIATAGHEADSGQDTPRAGGTIFPVVTRGTGNPSSFSYRLARCDPTPTTLSVLANSLDWSDALIPYNKDSVILLTLVLR